MSKADLPKLLNENERALLGEALSVLRWERGKAWNVACDRAAEKGKRRPPLQQYGIGDIKWLARRFDTKAYHWTEH